MIMKDVRKLPGFDQLNTRHIMCMFSRDFYGVHGGLILHRMFMRGEWFHRLPGGIQFTFKLMRFHNRSDAVTASMFAYLSKFKSLALTDEECALLLPCMLIFSLGLHWITNLI
jgi:hypothetical protein